MISGALEAEGGARPLRADAQRNRGRILTAASELFAERGLSVPLEDIARRAGVGVATLYRRFPTRADLAAAALERNVLQYTDAVDRAMANPQPWEGFRTLIFDLCELQASDAGLRDLLTTAFPSNTTIEQRINQALVKVKVLITRAQEEGGLRPDLMAADIAVMLLANAGVLATTADAAPDAWPRFAALMVDAFHARPDTPLPPAPPEQQLRSSIALLPGER